MSAAEGYVEPPADRLEMVARGTTIIVLALIISALLAIGSLVVTNGDGSRAAGELVTRFSLLIFVASLSVRPLALVFPRPKLRTIARDHESLRLAFMAVYAFALVCVIAPVTLPNADLTVGTVFYVASNTIILLIMLFTSPRASAGILGLRSWRALRVIATTYFWVAFLVADIAHIAAGANTGSWYRVSLFLLIATLGLRLAAIMAAGRVASPNGTMVPAPTPLDL
jgi:hypothetical protein